MTNKDRSIDPRRQIVKCLRREARAKRITAAQFKAKLIELRRQDAQQAINK